MWFFIAARSVSLVHVPLVTMTMNEQQRAIQRLEGALTPAGQLIMPNQIMTSQFLSIILCEVGNDIPIRECKGILLWLRRVPLNRQSVKLDNRTRHVEITFCELLGVIWPKSSVLLSCRT